MTSIQPPIVLLDRADIIFFASVDEAESWLEPVDAKAGSYRMLDSSGRELTASVGEVHGGLLAKLGLGRETVSITPVQAGRSAVDELRAILIGYLVRLGRGSKETLDSLPTHSLMARAMSQQHPPGR